MVSEYIKKLLNDKARLKKWKRITLALSCVVVFCVVYALTLPAITLEGKTICGMEEHTHTEDCYEKEEQEEEQPVEEENEVLNEPEETVQPDTQITSQEEEKVSEDEPKMVEDQTTTEQTDYQLKDSDITSIEVEYKDASGQWQKVDNGEVNPSNTEIYLKVNFEQIKTEDLLNQHNCTLTYQIPDFLRDAKGMGNLYEGTKPIGTIIQSNCFIS